VRPDATPGDALTRQDHVVADVDQRDRLVGRVVGDRPEFDLRRVGQRTRDATARPVRTRSAAAVPGEHGRDDVVGARAADHVRDERVAGDQTHVVRHLKTELG